MKAIHLTHCTQVYQGTMCNKLLTFISLSIHIRLNGENKNTNIISLIRLKIKKNIFNVISEYLIFFFCLMCLEKSEHFYFHKGKLFFFFFLMKVNARIEKFLFCRE